MRGFPTSGALELRPNEADAEAARSYMAPTSTGFKLIDSNGQANSNGETYIYIAIRRGPLAPPESGTEVFASDFARAAADGEKPEYRSGFPVDTRLTLYRSGGSSSYPAIGSRITGNEYLVTSSTAAGGAWTSQTFDYMNGFMDTAASTINTTLISHMWKRAPNFFDVTCHTSVGSPSQQINHNLGVIPEMVWIKSRNDSQNWYVYHKDLTAGKNLFLNTNDAETQSNTGTPQPVYTATYWTPGENGVLSGGGNTKTYIAYLFASLAGISKVGSYTGNGGASQDIDCGFTSGARFVLVKAASGTGDWWIWDTERGITAGNDSSMRLNTTDAEVTTLDFIDPLSSGFTVVGSDSSRNGSGIEYIFYAIA
jgi:hypothetical protein